MLRGLSILVLLLTTPVLVYSGEVLDRLVAAVNGRALLQSDVDEELRYECFASKRALQDLTSEDRQAALDRLIDQELLREQMRPADFKPVKSEEVDKAFATFKSDYSNTGGESWSVALAAYGIDENVVRNHIEIELNQLRVIDIRLRPSIPIDSVAIRTYYQEQLLAKLPPGQKVSLEEATPTIRELLIQQKMNESLESWLQALRAQARIERLTVQPEAKAP
jgi:parvulin-like peptidyl-prolyl isomerase